MFFTKPDSMDDVSEGYRGEWTAPRASKEKDYALIYVGEQKELVAVARLITPPFADETNSFGRGRGAFWARVSIVRNLARAVPLIAVKQAAEAHNWKAWQSLRGRRHITVPIEHQPWLTRLVAKYDSTAGRLLGAAETADPGFPDAGADVPRRGHWTTTRVIRDTRVGRALKGMYDEACQVCGQRLEVAPGEFYAEAHHLRPIGRPHNGPDRMSNVLVLCPTHHTEFDHALIAPHPRTRRLHTVDAEHTHRRRILDLKPFHNLDARNLTYHWRRFRRTVKRFASVRRRSG